VIQALLSGGVVPTACVEHALSPSIIEKAYNVSLPPVTAAPGSFESHLQAIRRQVAMNRLTGRCNIEIPYFYTMAPRIREAGSHHGVLTDEKSLAKLVFVDLTAEHWDRLKRLVDEKQEYAVNACITTGIGHIWQTMDMMAFSVAAAENPALLRTILGRYTEWTCRVVAQCNRIGIDFFWCFDDFAFKTGPVYSPELLREVVMPHARAVASEIRLPWIWHSDGNYMVVIEDITSLGMNALNPIEPGCLDLDYLLTKCPGMALAGGINVDILARGTGEDVRRAVRECFATMNRNGRYIASSSNSIPDYCKPENVKTFFEGIGRCGQAQHSLGRNQTINRACKDPPP
jgi:uroporphyrinogen decarboxylase